MSSGSIEVITKLVSYVKEKIKQALAANDRRVEQVELLIVSQNMFKLHQFKRLQIPNSQYLVDVIWTFQLLDIKQQQWKIQVKAMTLGNIGYQLKVNPPYDKNEVNTILATFNKNNQKKSQKCKAQIESDKTLTLDYSNPFHEYNKNKKIQKILQMMDKLQKKFQFVFKEIISYTSISYSFAKRTTNKPTESQQPGTINRSQQSQIPKSLSYVSQNILGSKAIEEAIPSLPSIKNKASNSIVKFFAKYEPLINENYINDYSQNSESVSVLMYGKYRLNIVSSLFEQSSVNEQLKSTVEQLKLIKKKIQQKIKQASLRAFTNQVNMLRVLRNDKSCEYIAQYFMKTIDQNETGNITQFFFVKIYDETFENIVRENKLTLQEYMKIFADITKGIYYLNKDRRILHRDIKASNICIDKEKGQLIPKIIDFGSSVEFSQPTASNSCFTQGYHVPFDQCPQQIKRKYKTKEKYNRNQSFDIYSLGEMLSWFLYCYMKRNVSQQYEAWSKCMNIIESCKQIDPDKRPQLEELIMKFTYLSLTK